MPDQDSRPISQTLPENVAVRLPGTDFWDKVQSARRRLLMLDYDGTLAPFHVLRMEAKPPSETASVLREIVKNGDTRIVIVSGRTTDEVRSLMPEFSLETFGSHGFEHSPRKGVVRRRSLSEREKNGLQTAKAAATAAGLSARIEEKPASLAVHTRGLDPDESMETEELAFNVFTPIAERHALECRAFNGGVEIRSRRFHKGLAVERLLDEHGDDVLAVYIGDDDTDEDAFRSLSGRGVGVRVGAASSETAAEFQLEDQRAVLPFLRNWQRACKRQGQVLPATHDARLVVVSNRLPTLETDTVGSRRRPVGGLATALEAALSQSPGGGLWFGWSGKTRGRDHDHHLEEHTNESVRLLGLDLTPREYEAYYNGFSNRTVWPLFHSFPSRAQLSSWQLEVYRSVNAMFARTLLSTVEANDIVWVHDYQLMLVGSYLREGSWQGRIGFFLHIPFPSLDILAILPDFKGFLNALLDYDVMGFHTRGYRDNYVRACRDALGAVWDGRTLAVGERRQRVEVYPVGIDVDKFLPKPGRGRRARMPVPSPGDTDVIIGVDRLDYTKGLPQRTSAVEALFRLKPQLTRKLTFIQICSPSRTDVEQYREQKRLMDTLVGRINGELGEHDWLPIRYLYRSYAQTELVELYRDARVGLVTPLRDGMNLVAKEYVAAQPPEDPGVLVLSRFAGAAEDMEGAVLVNPYLPDHIAGGIVEALEMPVEERRERHAAMLDGIKAHTVHDWARVFMNDLRHH